MTSILDYPLFFFFSSSSVNEHDLSLILQVALQFPDELLGDCVAVSAALEKGTEAKTYILGDTTYGR